MLSAPRRRHGEAGQAIVLAASMMVAITAAIGIAIDGASAFYYNQLAERAASAGALAGVIFMPNNLTTATSRAKAEAKLNGFDTADPNVTVTVGPSSAGPSTLQVTVSRNLGTFFMNIFGITQVSIGRTAVATYLAPIQLGQPGGQLGSTVSQLGSANNYFFQRTEGWGSDRAEGDPYTPNNCHEYGLNPVSTPCPNDAHQFSGSIGDPVGTNGPLNLPTRGGQNFLITVPATGGQVLVYNAMFAPDCNPDTGSCGTSNNANRCENQSPIAGQSGYGHGRPCATGNANYSYHEFDSFGGGMNSSTKYSAMAYTLFQVNNFFFRNQDVAISTMLVKPTNATNWDPAGVNPTYKDPTNGSDIVTQAYNGGCLPCATAADASNMWAYHHWLDPHTYNPGAADGNLVSLTIWDSSFPVTLPGGTYRLRVDTLNQDGTWSPYTNSVAHKGYAVAVSAPGFEGQAAVPKVPLACAQCTIGAWNDMTVYTPVVGTTWNVPIFQLPKSYAGQTVAVDIYDVGDVNGTSPTQVRILDPQTGLPASPATGKYIAIYDVGRQRLTPDPSPPGSNPCPYTGPFGSGENIPISAIPCTIGYSNAAQSAAFQSYSGNPGNHTWFNGHWVHMEIPIRTDYDPTGTDGYWRFQYYVASRSVPATDTFSVRVGLKGAPSHLLSS